MERKFAGRSVEGSPSLRRVKAGGSKKAARQPLTWAQMQKENIRDTEMLDKTGDAVEVEGAVDVAVVEEVVG